MYLSTLIDASKSKDKKEIRYVVCPHPYVPCGWLKVCRNVFLLPRWISKGSAAIDTANILRDLWTARSLARQIGKESWREKWEFSRKCIKEKKYFFGTSSYFIWDSNLPFSLSFVLPLNWSVLLPDQTLFSCTRFDIKSENSETGRTKWIWLGSLIILQEGRVRCNRLIDLEVKIMLLKQVKYNWVCTRYCSCGSQILFQD